MPTAAFDAIGTLFSLDVTRRALGERGAPEPALDLWLAQSLRDYFSLSLSGRYQPMREVLEAGLPRTLATLDVQVDDDGIDAILASLDRLEPADGAREACQHFIDYGWKVMVVTNASYQWAEGLLERSRLAELVHSTVSADDVAVSKPSSEVYEEAWESAMMPLWMIAAHGWDIGGAARANFNTAWISSQEKVYMGLFARPDVVADDLASAARQVVDQERRRQEYERRR